MPQPYFVTVRKQQKQELLEFIKAHKDKPLKQTLALFSLKKGLKVSTLETYVDELRDANLLMFLEYPEDKTNL